VLNWDLLGDLAVIGPIETDISPTTLVDGEDLVIGSEVFLIGYPGEVEELPQPAISRGLISRKREWEAIGMTYFQTDAAIAGGTERRYSGISSGPSNRNQWPIL